MCLCVIAAGVAVCGGALASARVSLPGTALGVYVALALFASALKVRLPGITGTYSLSFLFTLFGLTHFSLPETLAAALAGTLVQSYWRTLKRPTLLQAGFNLGNLAVSTGAAWLALHLLPAEPVLALALATAVYFFVNTILVSGVLSLLQGQPLRAVIEPWYLWSFSYYLIGAVAVGLLPAHGTAVPAPAWLLLLPVLYLAHFYYGLDHRTPEPPLPPARGSGPLPWPARLYAEAVIACGGALLVYALLLSHGGEPVRFASYLGLAVVAATLKVRLPGLTSTLSVGFVPVLVAVLEFRLGEALLLSALVGVMQCVWKPQQRPTPLQVLFNAACLVLSSGLAHGLCAGWPTGGNSFRVLPLVLATVVLYGSNTVLVTTVLCLVEAQPLRTVWQRCYFWSFPYYLVGAAAAGLLVQTSHRLGGTALLLTMPLLAMVFLSYRLQIQRVQVTPRTEAAAA